MLSFFVPQDPMPNPLPEMMDDNVSIAKEAFCREAITFRLGEEMIPLIAEAETAREMYDKLKRHHAMVCSSSVSSLQDELYEATIEGKTVLKLGADLRKTIFNLMAAAEVVDDASARRHLIRAVGRDPKFLSVITAVDNLPDTNFEDTLNRLMQAETRHAVASREADTSSETAMITNRSYGSFNGCWTCGSMEHIQAYCPMNRTTSQTFNRPNRGRGRGRFWSSPRPSREQVNMALNILASEQYYASRLDLTNAVQEEKVEVQRDQVEEEFEDAETG